MYGRQWRRIYKTFSGVVGKARVASRADMNILNVVRLPKLDKPNYLGAWTKSRSLGTFTDLPDQQINEYILKRSIRSVCPRPSCKRIVIDTEALSNCASEDFQSVKNVGSRSRTPQDRQTRSPRRPDILSTWRIQGIGYRWNFLAGDRGREREREIVGRNEKPN